MTLSKKVEEMARDYINKNPRCVVLGFGYELNTGRNITGYIIDASPGCYPYYNWEQTFTGDIRTFLYIAIPTTENLKEIKNKKFFLPDQLKDLGLNDSNLISRTIQL